MISMDAALAEHRYALEPVDTTSPEVLLLQRHWAALAVERALNNVNARPQTAVIPNNLRA